MTQPTLKDQLLALCDEHGLTSLSIGIALRIDREPYFCAYAHSDNLCGYAVRDDAADCLTRAISDLNSKRYAAPVVAELVAA